MRLDKLKMIVSAMTVGIAVGYVGRLYQEYLEYEKKKGLGVGKGEDCVDLVEDKVEDERTIRDKNIEMINEYVDDCDDFCWDCAFESFCKNVEDKKFTSNEITDMINEYRITCDEICEDCVFEEYCNSIEDIDNEGDIVKIRESGIDNKVGDKFKKEVNKSIDKETMIENVCKEVKKINTNLDKVRNKIKKDIQRDNDNKDTFEVEE